ncbi:DUF3239 domain-containing protein [Fibrella sp. WM1]|uniref:DUF3239 domain-containing protein n=1 Tax=Fibrella musci TaxID=3242485 RepID=UPI00352097A3
MPDNNKLGEGGQPMNFSQATRAANLDADRQLIKRYDQFQAKYVWLARITYAIGIGLLGLGVWLWQRDHGIWATVVGLLGLVVLLLGYMLGQGAGSGPYENGLLVPAIVTGTAPLTIAALANMQKDDSNEPVLWGVLKIEVNALPLHTKQVGEQVPCVALFSGDNKGYWAQLEPRPLSWATANEQVIHDAMTMIEPDEWRALNRLAPTLTALPPDVVHYYRADFTPVTL